MLRYFISFLKRIRNLYLVNVKWRKYKFGANFHAGRGVVMWAKKSIIIGDNCYIGAHTHIGCNISFGNNVLIAKYVAFVGRYDHHYQQIGSAIRNASQIRDKNYSWKELDRVTIVEDDVWIGHGAIIMSGVLIKKGSIIAAGSIVTKDVKAYSIYAGNPAKKISKRFNSIEDIEEHERILHK